ncbi:FMN-linked oxidoreductase [Conidiobolus coronatus NRRL 28638]|uniref:FMN-linked oxidoreductase n=1 Tax=Conidiobolus coronatus (strain ATCC 28846 / CBS 209.66 / NRRL 28638) TaxID=796925 RepID=A0A137P6V8_CONC2|nr:FMN-linked oxidoreductase [Conidiobolus coronatus NRRL 28638]|eukprot:KXN70709.1 FMN-linked oxidoreductase [Conidiobolus coronatus NRRL 28638]
MSHYTNLQQPLQLGNLKLKNRVLMSALARNRGIVPKEIHVKHYSQRAGAGFIISELILIEPQGSEYLFSSGLWSKQQVEAWKKVTDEVHAKGGIIFAQLVHFGRVANTLHNRGIPPPAPSSIRAKTGKFDLLVGEPGYSTPEAIEDPKEYIQLYKRAAENAKLAGFDGVELHAGSGYLPVQFLESHSNIRTDNYGGSIENRSRFILETIDALQEVYDKKQIGIKLSPSGGYNDSGEGSKDKIVELYSYLIKELDSKDIGYFQPTRYSLFLDPEGRGTPVDIQEFRPLIKNALLFANTGFSAEEGNNYLRDGKADAITYGMPFITNPDLPYRFFNGIPLNVEYNHDTFYDYPENQPHVGYTDYPSA